MEKDSEKRVSKHELPFGFPADPMKSSRIVCVSRELVHVLCETDTETLQKPSLIFFGKTSFLSRCTQPVMQQSTKCDHDRLLFSLLLLHIKRSIHSILALVSFRDNIQLLSYSVKTKLRTGTERSLACRIGINEESLFSFVIMFWRWVFAFTFHAVQAQSLRMMAEHL